jgi:hypothetical protein
MKVEAERDRYTRATHETVPLSQPFQVSPTPSTPIHTQGIHDYTRHLAFLKPEAYGGPLDSCIHA